MLSKYKNKLYCFSPPVMLATFIIEFFLAGYTFWKYKLNTTSKIAIIMLLALGSFQLSEYMICGGLELSNIDWARFGYISITLLPALGIHLITKLAGKRRTMLVGIAYATCAAFVAYYAINVTSVVEQACYANYAVFGAERPVSTLFGAYYYSWLIIGIALSWRWSRQLPSKKAALRSMAVGYLVFILPTAVVNTINPTTMAGIPSIMCGFAILFAMILVARVLPNSYLEKAPAPAKKQVQKT